MGDAQFAPVMRSADVYERIDKVGEGQYGEVYLARSKDDGSIVALKKIRMTKDQEQDGFPIVALREIRILKEIKHKNVIDLKEIVTHMSNDANHGKGSIYMVFDFMDYDLTGLMQKHSARFTTKQVKCYMQQLLSGMHYCHKRGVLHRDIKSANLLVNNRGELKIGDFGLARKYDPKKKQALTPRVITLWYRPLELLLGETRYGPEVDMWSIGCVFAELLLREPLLNGNTEPDQIDKICKLCGTPGPENWPAASNLPKFGALITQARKPQYPRRLKEQLQPRVPDKLALDLLDKLLSLDPETRISAEKALDHDYFWTEPMPAKPEELPKYASSHEMLEKKAQLKRAAPGAPPGGAVGPGARLPHPTFPGLFGAGFGAAGRAPALDAPRDPADGFPAMGAPARPPGPLAKQP
eukprot:CAMPEP_0206048578 /NCGR_PEP_ID=MMETSP1466-20131121/24469_1 /ASSEMBLY_ACC=CAM_ASM_001126 /TAXON_ID=44452 /ORGANISM="Pavlova gyrans, Strain CCMP608" /LENGTH=410 /DNA_ID=CAMNT_0053423641 /DNA_START=123 /DNA_END=1351 /DNA_ORIENTATION=-